jgi:DNA-binding MarR family transcriptional regulator
VQQLARETINPVSTLDCSEQLLEVTPLIMRRIRDEMRARTMPGLTVPQYRALNYIRKNPGASLHAVAAYLGMTAPSTSKLVQKLVLNRIVARRVAIDRRRVRLSLTEAGITALGQARAGTRQQLADSLKSLSQQDLLALSEALQALSRAFSQGGNDVNLS